MNTTWYFLPLPLMRFAKRFSDTVRYIDDLLTLNNNSFEEEIINIYPPELTLKRTTESNSRISYLDITYNYNNVPSMTVLGLRKIQFYISCPY